MFIWGQAKGLGELELQRMEDWKHGWIGQGMMMSVQYRLAIL
jgi:hypothetical protein